MPDFHSIRLHGPWNAQVLEQFNSAPGEFEHERRTTIPADWGDWLGSAFRGRVAYRRIFHLPTQLDPDQLVWLVIEKVDYQGSLFLNDQSIGTLRLGEAPLRVEVRQQLLETNLLCIEIELPDDVERGNRSSSAGGLIGGVRLEIQE